jgi:lipoprotein-anchoring transpeptidase ErfK/SrfK
VSAAATPTPAATVAQPLAILTRAGRAHARPDRRSRVIDRVDARRPITGVPTVLPVLERRTDDAGRVWLHVELPGRPNGHEGWIVATGARRATTPWRLRIDVGARRLTVRRAGRTVRRFPVIVGDPSTPTPRGRFFVEENVRLPSGAPGGPYALALSARSQVLQEFDGGPGQIALHGRDNVGGILGTAASHGCVRLDDTAITWLARRIPTGTPVAVDG